MLLLNFPYPIPGCKMLKVGFGFKWRDKLYSILKGRVIRIAGFKRL